MTVCEFKTLKSQDLARPPEREICDASGLRCALSQLLDLSCSPREKLIMLASIITNFG